MARHGARPHRRGMCAACVARQPPGIRQTPGGRRLRAHDCPCWRVKPLLLSNGSPRAVGFPLNASPYQLARRRRPQRSGVLAGTTGLTNALRFRGWWHVYPCGAEPGLARPARRRRRCLQGRPPVGAPRQQGSLLASSWRPRGRCPVAPARSEAEAAANAHIVVGDVSQDVVEIPTGLTPRAQVLQPRRLITASLVIPIGFPPLVVRSVQHTVGRSASQTVITARPASAGAGNRTAE